MNAGIPTNLDKIRTGCQFGQKKAKNMKKSPNWMAVRTERGQESEKESELGISSDRKRPRK
jgi:hypothetical protein